MATGNGQPRTYIISTETANGVVNSDMLTAEIEADPTVGPLTLDRIDTGGGVLDIYFAAPLSAGEQTALDAVVLAHQGTQTFDTFQFWESNPFQSTALEAFQNAMTQQAQPMAAGPYVIDWYCEMRVVPVGPINSRGNLRFQIDGVSKGNSTVVTDEWIAMCGWDRFFAAEGATPTFTLDWRRDPALGGNDTIEIRKMKIGFQQVTA